MEHPKTTVVVDLDDKPEYQRLVAPEAQTLGMKAGRVHLKAGASCGEHSTKDMEELLVFLSGHGRLIIGQDEVLDVGCGKVAYIPPQTAHDVQNTTDEPLVYVFCVAPAGQETVT